MNDVVVTIAWEDGHIANYECIWAIFSEGYMKLSLPNSDQLMFIPYTAIHHWFTRPAGRHV